MPGSWSERLGTGKPYCLPPSWPLTSLRWKADTRAMDEPNDDGNSQAPNSFTDAEGRVWIKRGHAKSKEELIEWMVEYAVEEEMKRRHPDTYQDPDDRAGTA